MNSEAQSYVNAARVPDSVPNGEFGLWKIDRILPFNETHRSVVGYDSYTALYRITEATMHLDIGGEIVMEDSTPELCRHLPIWMCAAGRVLVTGLGLGCVVRGLLFKPNVEHVDVIEIDHKILDVIGPEFENDDRVTLIHGDALKHPINGSRWNFAWHDIWSDEAATGVHLQHLHAELLFKFGPVTGAQGAWQLPRWMRRLVPTLATIW